MKIALVTEFFHPTTGGTQTAVAGIAEALSRRGHRITVFAPLFNSPQPSSQPGKTYTTVWLQAPARPIVGHLLVQWNLLTKLAPYEVIHLFHPAFGLAARWAQRYAGKRLIATLMGYDTYGFASMPWVKQQIALSVCQHAHAVTSPSRDLADLARQTGVQRNIEIIPHGVTPTPAAPGHVTELKQQLGLTPEETVFLAVQRHYPIKEPQVFLAAWQALARPNCRLILVGGGELEPSLRRQIAASGLTNITLTGEVGREVIPSYLALADVFLHHSRYESFGLGVLEAMQAGLPVIACRVGAIKEIITDGLDGLLIQPSDPAAMAAAVKRLAQSPARRAKLGQAAREKARHFTWQHLVKQYEKLYLAQNDGYKQQKYP